MKSNIETAYEILGLLVIFVFGTLTAAAFIIHIWIPFQRERDYIKMEIARSDNGERRYWERQLKNLYISRIPVIKRIRLKK